MKELSRPERKALHIALEQSNGEVSKAAMLAEFPETRLRKLVREDEEFATRWGDGVVNPPTKEELAHRPPVEPEDSPETKYLTALKKEEKQLTKGLETLGITGRALNESLAASAFQSTHLDALRQITNAGQLKTYAMLGVLFDDLRSEIGKGVEAEREGVLYDALFNCVKNRSQINQDIWKSALIDAQIKSKQNESKGGSSKKPGFSPILNNITVQTDAKEVTVKKANATTDPKP